MLLFLLVIKDEQIRSKLEEIYLYYNKELYYTAYSILKDHYEAQDVVQNTILKLSNNLEKIGEIKCNKTRAYLIIIVRNLSCDVYNKKKKVVSVNYNEIQELELIDDINLESHILQLENSKMMAKNLSQINQSYADILTLRYYYEYSISEIATLLDLSVNSVSVKIYRAKQALKRILTNGGESIEKTI